VITNTNDPALYSTARFGTFTYTISPPAGSYTVTLKFAEIYWTSPGNRVFNVAINGTTVLSNFDITAAAGAAFKAVDESFPVTTNGGNITIQFTAVTDNPLVNAIQVVPGSGIGVSVSPPSATLNGGQTQQFTATVTGTGNTSVTWSLNPQIGSVDTTGLYMAPSSVSSQQMVTVTATSVADTTQKATATVTLNPPSGSFSARINAGGPLYTDSASQTWSADTGFSGGSAFNHGTLVITNTNDPALYSTARFGTFTYTISPPAGSYTVTLKFAEIYWTSPGNRVFNVAINGTTVLSNFDITAAAGAAFKAVDESFPVTTNGGNITIQFTAVTDNPLVNAIQVVH